MTGQSETANLRSASVQDVEQNSFALLYANRLPMVQHPAIDRKRTVANFESMWLSLCQGSLHRGLALLFERLHTSGRRKEIHCHVSTLAEGGLEFFQDEKDLAIIITRLMLWLDVDRADLSAVLAGGQIRPRTIMRVVETKACRPWGENNPAFPTAGNERRAFFSRSVHVNRHHLAVPMQLL